MVEARKVVLDMSAWGSNVCSAVLIVFINKALMGRTGYAFRYATTLCALHYMACTVSIWMTRALGGVKYAKLPFKDLVLFTATANVSVVCLNLSLMFNPVSLYQIAKLLIVPFVCLVEKFWLGREFTRGIVIAVLVVVTGVAVVTITDVGLGSNPAGLAIAGMSVASSGMQQIFCRTMQQKHKLSSPELLANTAPAQTWTLFVIGPFLDRYISSSWVFDFIFGAPALVLLLVSCGMAVIVNISQFVCLGRFSAVSFQVLGHTKTILVLLGGWMFLGDSISGQQFGGMCLAVAGMVAFGIESSKAPNMKNPVESPSTEGLLQSAKLRDTLADPLNSKPGIGSQT
ncbi:hypothetical protein ABBQ32_008821 [Trebouxia sp. C0010 RCD-2024]